MGERERESGRTKMLEINDMRGQRHRYRERGDRSKAEKLRAK